MQREVSPQSQMAMRHQLGEQQLCGNTYKQSPALQAKEGVRATFEVSHSIV